MHDRLQNTHLTVGIISLIVFLATGQYLHWWHSHFED